MKIKWLGHSAFKITTHDGVNIITDPYQSGCYNNSLRYGPIREAANIVTISHLHPDHGYPNDITGKPQILDPSTDHIQINGISFSGTKTFHDKFGGSQRGENTVFCFLADGIKICHLGDLGTTLSDEQLRELMPVNILLVPVGGTATIDAKQADAIIDKLAPNISIPMHFRNSKCLFSFDSVDEFLKGKTNVTKISSSEVEISADRLPDEPEILVLEPAL